MNEQKIVNMHVTSDRAEELGLKHFTAFRAEPIGQIETINGKQYRVIDNTSAMIVTYEPVEKGAQA